MNTKKNINMKQLSTLISLYPDIIWGYSDHSIGSQAACTVVEGKDYFSEEGL